MDNRESSAGQPASPGYAGVRILKAMRSAPHYADVIYAKLAPLAGKQPILDFGAGDGVFAEKFLQQGVLVECIEPDPANQAALRARALTVVSDVRALATERYSLIYTINVLEHLHDLDHDLAELYRVTRPGGRLFVFVPAFNIIRTSLDDEVGHVQRFTRKTLATFLSRAGFETETSRYFDSLGFFSALIVRGLEAIGLFKYSPATIGFYDKAILPLSMIGDHLMSGIIGKNVIAVARKADRTS